MDPLAGGVVGNQPAPSASKTKEADDRLLALRAQGGDRDAYADLVMRYTDRLHAMLVQLCGGDRELAGELTQEAFVRAYDRLALFSAQSSFYTWLYRLARNRALDILMRKRPAPLSEGAAAESASTAPERRIHRQELIDSVQTALAALPIESRELLLLREFDGWDYERIAMTLEVPIGTVKSRLARARVALRERLAGRIAVEDL